MCSCRNGSTAQRDGVRRDIIAMQVDVQSLIHCVVNDSSGSWFVTISGLTIYTRCIGEIISVVSSHSIICHIKYHLLVHQAPIQTTLMRASFLSRNYAVDSNNQNASGICKCQKLKTKQIEYVQIRGYT